MAIFSPVAIDGAAGKLYWTNFSSIRRANLDGTDRETILRTEDVYGLALGRCAVGSSEADCNFNNVPDECEPDEDCNHNAVRAVQALIDRVRAFGFELATLDVRQHAERFAGALDEIAGAVQAIEDGRSYNDLSPQEPLARPINID